MVVNTKVDIDNKIDWEDVPKPFGGFIKMEDGIEIIIKFLDNDLRSSPGFQGKGVSYQFNVEDVTNDTIMTFSTGSLQLMSQLKALLPLADKTVGITMHEREGFRDYDIRTI